MSSIRLILPLLGTLCACAGVRPSYTEKIPRSKIAFDMVFVPGKTGVKPFWIGKTELTLEEYEEFYLTKETTPGLDAISRPSPSYEPHDRGWGRENRPAIGMSWNAARIYCEWISKKTGHAYRLPTEAEWELACEGSSPAEAWSQEVSEGKTQEVARKKPNPLGIFDMLGNVWEYCEDTVEGRPVLRGGSWRDPQNSLNAKTRTLFDPQWNARDPQRPRSKWWVVDAPFIGFRLARSAD